MKKWWCKPYLTYCEFNPTNNYCSVFFLYISSTTIIIFGIWAPITKHFLSSRKNNRRDSPNSRTCTSCYCLRTLFELRKKFSWPATVEWSLPAAQPLFITWTALRAGSPVTRVPSSCFSCSGRPIAFLSFLLLLSSSLSFLSQLSTVL